MSSNFNPMAIINLIRSGKNPEQLMISYLESQLKGTPLGENLVTLAKNNNTAEIEKIARNICEQRGLNYDKEFNDFKQRLGF